MINKGFFDALAEAIKQMKKKLLSSIDCRKRSEEHFDKDKCFEKYIELYKELLK